MRTIFFISHTNYFSFTWLWLQLRLPLRFRLQPRLWLWLDASFVSNSFSLQCQLMCSHLYIYIYYHNRYHRNFNNCFDCLHAPLTRATSQMFEINFEFLPNICVVFFFLFYNIYIFFLVQLKLRPITFRVPHLINNKNK